MRSLLLVVGMLAGCYAPDYTKKACVDNLGCPAEHSCQNGFCAPLGPSVTRCESDSGCGTDQLCKSGLCINLPKDVRVDPPSMSIPIGYSMNDGSTINDYPAHYRNLTKSYYLDAREVTVERYQECVDARGCLPIHVDMDNKDCNGGKAAFVKHPANCVDYGRAEAYCAFIGRRLPTETEWEYAARGNNPSTLYPWGAAWNADNACFAQSTTCESGTKLRTYLGSQVTGDAPGFYDLAGNVWEWTSSEFCPYSMAMMEGVTCGSDKRTIRGGAAILSPSSNLLRVTARFGNLKTDVGPSATIGQSGWHPNLGFRCARDAN